MSSGSRRLTLDAGQQLVYDEQGVQATSVVAASDVSAWRTGALSFVAQAAGRGGGRDQPLPARQGAAAHPERRRLVRMRFSITQMDGALAMIRDPTGAT
jgi:transmembrane sensor